MNIYGICMGIINGGPVAANRRRGRTSAILGSNSKKNNQYH